MSLAAFWRPSSVTLLRCALNRLLVHQSSSTWPRSLARTLSTIATNSGPEPIADAVRALPLTCPGCGAFSQSQDAGRPGFFSTKRKQVYKFLLGSPKGRLTLRERTENQLFADSLARVERNIHQDLDILEEPTGEDANILYFSYIP